MKKKKIKKILMEELEWTLERNRIFRIRNSMENTPYMDGVDDTAKKIKKIAKKIFG